MEQIIGYGVAIIAVGVFGYFIKKKLDEKKARTSGGSRPTKTPSKDRK